MTDDSLQRESFEKWYALHWHRNELSERIADDYVFPLVQEKWECWLAALSAQTEARDGDAERLNWLANGGWEVMQDPDMWPPNLNFRETIDHGRVTVSVDAIGRKIAQGDL